MKRRTLLQAAGAATSAALAGPLIAQPRTAVVYGYSAVSDYATVFVGVDEGLFAKRGLDLEPKFIPLNPTIIPGIESGSLQMGGPTPTGYLQSVDGGLQHVVIGGGGVLSKTYTELGLLARAGAGIRSAQDCVGKKIGVPGLGALLHVTFRQWLKVNGVDFKQVNFIEAPFPQHADLLRGGSLDAVVSGGPFMARIIDSGVGYVASYYTTFLPEGYPTILHVTRRDWAEKNPAVVKAFRDGITEAASFIAQPKNDGRVRETLAKYLKVPPAVAAKMQISPPGPVVTVKQLQWWASLMQEQALLKQAPNLPSLLFKA